MTNIKITLAKLVVGLCFLCSNIPSYAQIQHFALESNVMVNGFTQINTNKALLYGQHIVNNNFEAFLFELENDSLNPIALPQEFNITNIVNSNIVNDTLYVFGSYHDILNFHTTPFLMKLSLSYNLLEFKAINLEPNEYTFGNPLYVNNKFLIPFNKINGNNTDGIYLTLIDKNANIEAVNFITNPNPETIFFCSSLTEGFTEGKFIFSLFKLDGEEIYELDTNMNYHLLKKMPHKDSATPNNEGFFYINSYGAKVLNNKLYFSIEYRQLRVGLPSQQFLSIYQLSNQLDSITITNTGILGEYNEIGGFEYSNNHFYIAGVDETFGFYPPKEYNNDIVVSKVDTTGHIVWSATYNDSSNFVVRLVKGTNDGGCLVVGSRYLEGETQRLDPFILKINNQGHINSIITIEKPNIDIFPNPTSNGLITVKLPINNGVKHWQYKVCNQLGQLLQQGTLKQGENSIQLNSNLRSGNYLISFYRNNALPVTKQIIKL